MLFTNLILPAKERLLELGEYPMHEFIEAAASFPALRTDDDVCIRPMTEDEYVPVDRYITVSKAHKDMFGVVSRSCTTLICVLNGKYFFCV